MKTRNVGYARISSCLYLFIYLILFEINNFGFGSDLKFLTSAETHPSEQRRLCWECEARKLHKMSYTKSYQILVSPYIVSPLPTKQVMKIIKKIINCGMFFYLGWSPFLIYLLDIATLELHVIRVSVVLTTIGIQKQQRFMNCLFIHRLFSYIQLSSITLNLLIRLFSCKGSLKQWETLRFSLPSGSLSSSLLRTLSTVTNRLTVT